MNGWRKSGQLHSAEKERSNIRPNSYANYFEGCTFVKTADNIQKGIVTKRIYTGDYFVRKMSRRAYFINSAVTALLSFLCISAFLAGALSSTPGNFLAYVAAAEMAAFFCILFVTYSVINLLLSPRKMTIGAYKSFVKVLPISAFVAAVILGMLALVRLAAAVVCEGDLPFGLISAASFFLSGICSFYIFRREKHAEYECLSGLGRQDTYE